MKDISDDRCLKLDLVDHSASRLGLDPAQNPKHDATDGQDHEQAIVHEDFASPQ